MEACHVESGHAFGSIAADGVIQEGKDENSGNKEDRDDRGDDLHGDQEDRADQDGDDAGLTHGAADVAQEHVLQRRAVCQVSVRQIAQRSRAGHSVDARLLESGQRPCGHIRGKGQEQGDTADDRRVREVPSHAAEELFDNNDGDKAADDADQDRHEDGILDAVQMCEVGRQVQSQDQACDQSTAVAHSIGLVENLFIRPLKEGAADHAHRNHDDCGNAEIQDTHGCSGQEGCHNIQHGPGRIQARHQMGRGGYSKIIIIFLITCHCLPPPSPLPCPACS